MNDNKKNYEKIEKFYKYYHYDMEKIKEIISKDVRTLNTEEWRTLIQMIYSDKMIASGLFQAILIFEIESNGKRKDPPIEAYDSVDQVKGIGDCLIFKIMDFIESNSCLKFNDTWYSIRKKLESSWHSTLNLKQGGLNESS